MFTEFNYAEPFKLDELFALMQEHPHTSKVMAGGTDLLVNLRSESDKPVHLINIKRVKEISNQVLNLDTELVIGPLVTLSDIVRNSHIRNNYPALAKAAEVIGSIQIRNRATLVGNICNASPAADTAPALLLYDASVTIRNSDNEKVVPLSSFFTGPHKTILGQGEIVSSVVLPIPPAETGAVFLKLSRRQGADLAIIGVAAMVSKSGEIRLAYGAAGPVPFRAYKAEQLLRGSLPDDKRIAMVMPSVLEAVKPIGDIRSSLDYRLAMLEIYTERALKAAKEIVVRKGS